MDKMYWKPGTPTEKVTSAKLVYVYHYHFYEDVVIALCWVPTSTCWMTIPMADLIPDTPDEPTKKLLME